MHTVLVLGQLIGLVGIGFCVGFVYGALNQHQADQRELNTLRKQLAVLRERVQ